MFAALVTSVKRGGEPSEVNSTSNPSFGKWDRWLGYNDPDSSIGVIDYYEGGRYYDYGLYRPSNNSMMRALGRPFDAISRERFIQKIYAEVDPLDSWLATGPVYLEDDVLWVDTVDPSVIGVEWFLDGVSLGLLGELIIFIHGHRLRDYHVHQVYENIDES